MNKRWIWETDEPTSASAAGNFAKQFRNLQIKQPGVLGRNAPAPDATLIAREVIQNSWDSAMELRAAAETSKTEAPDFDIEFRFERRDGDAAGELWTGLSLDDHMERLGRIADVEGGLREGRKALGLGPSDCLDGPHSRPLSTLTITESGTAGMYGPWRARHSKMYLALVSIGFTQKQAGAGGSYGFGKAGLIRGSRIRTVVAYSCFRERSDDPGVSRRLLGMTYWGGHELGELSYTGFGRLGAPDGTSAKPFENEEADDLASRIGLTRRDPADEYDLGTTFLLLDSGLEPTELISAIERNWWPALEDKSFSAVVVDSAGNRLKPNPAKRPDLKPFVTSLSIATGHKEAASDSEKLSQFAAAKVSTGQSLALGQLGMVAKVNDWSYPSNQHDDVDHKSLVALVRGPRMVVEYLECGNVVPHIRGVFVADEGIDDFLRQTEPPLHDAWDTHSSADEISPVATELATHVARRIKSHVRQFRNDLRPPAPSPQDLRLDLLEDLMTQMFTGDGTKQPPPPPGPPRKVSISIENQQIVEDPVDDSRIRYLGRAVLALTENVSDEAASVLVMIRYKFVEDGAAGEQCALSIKAPAKFKADPKISGGYVGELGHDGVVFGLESDSYDSDWTGQISVEAELAQSSEKIK